jgi:squalene/oxidosqualene cyclase-like protein
MSGWWKRWRLKTDRGRQLWQFNGDKLSAAQLEEMQAAFVYGKKQNPNSGDRVFRAQQLENYTAYAGGISSLGETQQALVKGANYYQYIQSAEGHWAGDYGGPMFLTPGLVIISYITRAPLPSEHAVLIRQYMLNHQNDDGGWGLHLEGDSTMFGTVLQYVSLRILGEEAGSPAVQKARHWMLRHGGAVGTPSWGKFYLAALGVYEWEGCNSLLPELWLLPKWLPIHPWRYWCHTRMVYLPMGYCYGSRVVAEETPLIRALRNELYTQEYAAIDWKKERDNCSPTDIYYPHHPVLKVMNRLLNFYEKHHIKSWRKKAMGFMLDYINAEDEHTSYINIGPVNKVLNSLCIYNAYGNSSVQFKKHEERWFDYLWLAEDGMKVNGYNGSQLWDVAFAVQAFTEGGVERYFPEMVTKAIRFTEQNQVIEEVNNREKFFRHISKGGWPFSTRDHGWPITDCTAEGLKVMLGARAGIDTSLHISDSRFFEAVEVMLSFQNKDGSWASYENTRSAPWIEALNPAEVFGDIMIDYGYTECTSASVQGLIAFTGAFPNHRKAEIDAAIKKGIAFVLSQQRADGSWYGSWAVCFTYGTWFGVELLSEALHFMHDERIARALQKAQQFLLSRQNTDGGWGESFESCVKKEYIPAATSQVVNTAWALLSLMRINGADKQAIDKGIRLLLQRQTANGDWEQENISGVFNHNCMITYSNYRNIFPLWALGRYAKLP